MEDEQNFSLPGFPPLPKCLIAAIRQANTSSPLSHAHSFQDSDLYVGASTSAAAAAMQGPRGSGGSSHRHGRPSSTQEPLNNGKSIHSRASSTHSGGLLDQYQQQQQQQHNHPRTDNDCTSGSSTTSKLDTQLAILRREMYDLRQMDLSLLWQFWALNKSLQEFKVYIQELEALSPSSPSPTPSETNSTISEPDEESYSGQNSAPLKLLQQPPVATSSNFSSKNSSMSKHQPQHYNSRSNLVYTGRVVGDTKCSMPPHAPPVPQKTHLPRILQERIRRAPPPIPPNRPNRPKPSKSGSSNSLSHGGEIGGHQHSKTTSKSSSPSPSPGPTNASGITRRSLSCQFSLRRAKSKKVKGKHTRKKD